MRVKTTDNKIIELNKTIAFKSCLFSNLESIKTDDEPIPILIDSKTMLSIYEFMKNDNHVLKKDYNPLEIYFSNETLSCFDGKQDQEIINICNGANYLEYPYLLELCCKILAMRLSQNSLKTKNEILGEKRISDEDIQMIMQDYDWVNDNI